MSAASCRPTQRGCAGLGSRPCVAWCDRRDLALADIEPIPVGGTASCGAEQKLRRLQGFRDGRPRRREEPPLVAFNLAPGSAQIVNSTPAASSRSRTKSRLIGCRHCPPDSRVEMAFSLTPIRVASLDFDHPSNARAALTCWDVSVIPASFLSRRLRRSKIDRH